MNPLGAEPLFSGGAMLVEVDRQTALKPPPHGGLGGYFPPFIMGATYKRPGQQLFHRTHAARRDSPHRVRLHHRQRPSGR